VISGVGGEEKKEERVCEKCGTALVLKNVEQVQGSSSSNSSSNTTTATTNNNNYNNNNNNNNKWSQLLQPTR